MATATIHAPSKILGAYRQPLLSGDPGTEQTIALMRRLIDEALRDSSIIRLAKDIVSGVAAFDEMGEAGAVYHWVLNNIRFTKDPVNKEALYPPAELLKIRAGDCDDISMLMATLLMALGYPARLITVSANPGDPSQFSHVYVEGQVGGAWIPLDAARPDSVFGEAPPMYYRKRAWSLVDDSFQDLSGLGNYPRFNSLRGLGDDPNAPNPQDTSVLVATVAQGASEIIQAARQPVNPWGSFATPYTPGAVSAGYSAPGTSVSVGTNAGIGTWLLIGLAVYFLTKGR